MGTMAYSLSLLMCVLVLIPDQGQLQQQTLFSVWEQINLTPVCFQARGKKPGVVRYLGSEGKLLSAVKLVHREGHVRCEENRAFNSRWGCYHNRNFTRFPLNVVVTDNNDNLIFPPERYIRNRGLWYNLPFTDALHSDELVFTEYAHPFYLTPRSEVKIWYGEDLKEWKNSDNVGRACVDIYAHLQ